MQSPWPKCLPALLLGLAGVAAAPAADTVIADFFDTRFPQNWYGYGGSLTVVHSEPGGGVVVAATDTQVPVGSLFVVDVDAYRLQTGRLTVSAGLSVGDAKSPTTSDSLYKARISADLQLDSHWFVHAGDQYVDLNAIRGQLASGSAEYRPSPQWGVKLGGGYSISGTLADRYAETALHWYGTTPMYGGLVVGRTGYDPANLGLISVVRQLRQEYVGAGIPLRRWTLNLEADNLTLNGQSRQTVHIGVTRAIRP
jgi:hypothetical protein